MISARFLRVHCHFDELDGEWSAEKGKESNGMTNDAMYDEDMFADFLINSLCFSRNTHDFELHLFEADDTDEIYKYKIIFRNVHGLKISIDMGERGGNPAINKVLRKDGELSTNKKFFIWNWVFTFYWPNNDSTIEFSATSFEKYEL